MTPQSHYTTASYQNAGPRFLNKSAAKVKSGGTKMGKML